jgi:hypothetical protein
MPNAKMNTKRESADEIVSSRRPGSEDGMSGIREFFRNVLSESRLHGLISASSQEFS